ncbi:MAG: hypothetical protein CV087_22670 [Candidatus Brocadia sp. WS118]|nr:MAG: hypothetical protein CV087_22670 [Candidatus Brocadia sp. WS118]
MNDKDREAFEDWFNANCLDLPTDRKTKIECIADRQALHHNWQRAWQAALEYAHKEQRELLERCEEAFGEISVKGGRITRDIAHPALAALHAAGIGKKARESGIPKHPSNQG